MRLKTNYGPRKSNRLALFIFAALFIVSGVPKVEAADTPNAPSKSNIAPVVTFIELGSVNCIPCKAMQPIMDEVRNKYPGQVRVVFHDVWTPKGQPYGQFFKIKVIPYPGIPR